MIIAVSGTPGVGKTTVSKLLSEKLGYEYVSIKELAVSAGLGERVEDEVEIDVGGLAEVVKRELSGKNVVLDGHLSHLMPADVVVVLRTDPRVLVGRLIGRGYSRKKVGENLEAELIDLILVEAVETHERVLEVDTTRKKPEDVVDEVLKLLSEGVQKRVGIVDWSETYPEIEKHLLVGDGL